MNRRGFTLIEIILVLALIGVLGTWMISLINPTLQFKKGRDAQRKAELAQLQATFELYRADKNEYPLPPLPTCGDPLEGDNVVYIQKIPCDDNDQEYNYDRPTETTYSLIACLENVNDPQRDETNDSRYCTGDTNWSYTVVNP